MKWKTSRGVAENTRALLPKLAAKYFEAGRQAARCAKPSLKDLHRFRLATKRFRYSLELFGLVYGASLDRRLGALRKLQTVLGELSDCRSLEKLFAEDRSLKVKLQQLEARKWKKFRQEWKAFDSGGQLKNWKAYLARSR